MSAAARLSLAALLTLACDAAPLPQTRALPPLPRWDASSNLLANASFETGRAPWFSLAEFDTPRWRDFAVSSEYARSGRQAALLRLHSEGVSEDGYRIHGAIQDHLGPTLPRRLGGYYRVERWQRGTPMQYVQVVVTLLGVRENRWDPTVPFQLAYLLAGLEQPPTAMFNRRFVVAGEAEPRLGEWVAFDFDLHRDFQEHWGFTPGEIYSLRVFLEVRYDYRKPTDGESHADVYYDDIYLGDGGDEP